MTLIVLLILAGVSISGLFSEGGLFNKAEDAANKYSEAKAREVLATVLLTSGQYEKNTNLKYNQDDFLDELIKSEIPGSDVKGDVAIIGEYAYELDRSVPKIGRYLGKASDLVFPTVTASTPILADDYRTSTFTVTAIEEKNGINKIEIWFAGERIETLTKTYDNIKTEIKENYTVNRNGTYTIKAYGDLMASTTVEVTGIVPAVEFSPNGNTEWNKEHTTKITVKETGERVTSLKYKWTTSGANEPAKEEFIQDCPADNIITGKDFTGTYFLWILLTTETGKTNICGSEGFKFDNKGPTITSVTVDKYSADGITVNIVAKDTESGISRLEIYIDNEQEPRKIKKLTNTISNISENIPVTGLSMGEHNCKVIVYDDLENNNFKYDSTLPESPILPEGYNTTSLGNLTSGTGVSFGKRFYVYFNLKLYLCESDAKLEFVQGSGKYWLMSSTRKNIYNQQNRKNNRKTELRIMGLNIVLKEMHTQTTTM